MRFVLNKAGLAPPLNFLRSKAGFTLIELLVVISIIGILASIVLVSLNSAQRKARDTKRISSIHQIRLALELYFDGVGNGQYPPGTNECTVTTGKYNGLENLITSNYVPQIPRDPLSGNTDGAVKCYGYASGVLVGDSARTSYHLYAELEDVGSNAFNDDRDCDSADNNPHCAGTVDNTTSPGGALFTGAKKDGTNDAANKVYDFVP